MLKRIVRYMLVVTVAAVLYAAWVFISRYDENRRLEEADRRRRAEAASALPEQLRGSGVKILQFYAVPAALQRGERGQICYGVLNAESVRMEPDTGKLSPALSRCIEIAPRATTRYTLTAVDKGGRAISESFVLNVNP